jgi:hypothetical protein
MAAVAPVEDFGCVEWSDVCARRFLWVKMLIRQVSNGLGSNGSGLVRSVRGLV